MNQTDFLKLVATLAECPPEQVSIDTPLESLSGWDSLSVIGFIAAVGRELDARVQATSLKDCKSVRDLMSLVDDKITP